MGAKSQNFIATAILISAVMLACTAEAAPPNFGNKQIVKRGIVITRYERHHTKFADWATCVAYNKSPGTVCAVYDVYPVEVLNSGRPVHGTVKLLLGPKVSFQVYAASIDMFHTQTLQCKLSYAVYRPANYPWC
jgi:hypothetical protein